MQSPTQAAPYVNADIIAPATAFVCGQLRLGRTQSPDLGGIGEPSKGKQAPNFRRISAGLQMPRG